MKLVGGIYCAAVGCSNNRRRDGMSFFVFPKDMTRRQQWINNTQRAGLTLDNVKNLRLCSQHFELDQFMNSTKKSLVWNAVPTIFANAPVTLKRKAPEPDSHGTEKSNVELVAEVPENHAPRLPRRSTIPTCFVPKCRSDNIGNDVNHTFRPHSSVAKEWKRLLATVRSDLKYNPKRHSVCFRHFNPCQILKEDTVIVDDNTLTVPKARWQLANDAVPVLVPEQLGKDQNLHRKKRWKPLEECVDLYAPPQWSALSAAIAKDDCVDSVTLPPSSPEPMPESEATPESSISALPQSEFAIAPKSHGQENLKPSTSSKDGTSAFDDLFQSWPANIHPDWASTIRNGSWYLLQIDFTENAASIVKYMEIKSDRTFRVVVGNVEYTPLALRVPSPKKATLKSYEDIALVLEEVKCLRVCGGLLGFDRLVPCPAGTFAKTSWRSVNCRQTTGTNVCDKCMLLREPLIQRMKIVYKKDYCPVLDKSAGQEADKEQGQPVPLLLKTPNVFWPKIEAYKLVNLRSKFREVQKRCRSLTCRLNKMTKRRDALKVKLGEVNRAAQPEAKLETLLDSVDIMDGVKVIVKAAFAAAKAKSVKAIRHSIEWLTLSYELMQKSSRAYSFLLKRKILPLPSERTIQRWKLSTATKLPLLLPPLPEPKTMTYDFFEVVLAPQQLQELNEPCSDSNAAPPDVQQAINEDGMVEIQVVTLRESDIETGENYRGNLIELALACMQ